MNIVLYSDDINLLSYWEKSIPDSFEVAETLEELYKFSDSIIVLNYSACQGKCAHAIAKLKSQNNRALILHRTPLFQTAQELLNMGAYGYGNAIMRAHFIISAINAIKENMIWLYPEFTSELIASAAPAKSQNEVDLSSLSTRERSVALLLKDGIAYKDIAQKLDITPRTVKAHAQKIYAKLNVKDRLALALLFR